jgi:hypothetical protein
LTLQSSAAGQPDRAAPRFAHGRFAIPGTRPGKISARESVRRLFESVVLARLGAAGARGRVRDLPHSKLCSVEFISIDGRGVTVDLPSGADGEISVKRSLFDDLLLRRARELGANVHEQTT